MPSPAAHDFARVSVHPTPVRLQATLEVGAVDDPHEREAERVADQVMRAQGGEVHADGAGVLRRCSCGGTCPACRAKAQKRKEELARAPEGGGPAPQAGAAPPAVHDVLRGPGHPLDGGAASFLEPRFGHSFERVRVHTDARAAASAKAVGARAYTVGRHVVFGAGQYRPESAEGRRLLAHELAHVLQQDAGAVLRRVPAPGAPAADPAQAQAPDAPPGTAQAPAPTRPSIKGPRLDVTKKPSPCACIVFIHNDERNARLTAQALHQACSYNLAIIEPDNRGRLIEVAGRKGVDPNGLFPPEVVSACRADPAACDKEVDDNAAKPTRRSTQKQFFMAVRDCSEGFSLPVVALHNNVISDTRALLKKKDTITRRDKQTKKKVPVDPFEDLPRDIDKPAAKGSKETVERMKEVLGKHFDLEPVMRSGMTNIFRWCQGKDIGRCHIGDPHHPDNLVWVTNPNDFEKVKKNQPTANVVLQTSAGPESTTDLSTLFLTLESLVRGPFEIAEDFLRLLEQAAEGVEWLAEKGELEKVRELMKELADAASGAQTGVRAAADAAADTLHFVNIETPNTAIGVKTDADMGAHRVAQYEAVVQTLAALDLHCCGTGDAATDADKAIREKLLAGEKKEEKPKAKPKPTPK